MTILKRVYVVYQLSISSINSIEHQISYMTFIQEKCNKVCSFFLVFLGEKFVHIAEIEKEGVRAKLLGSSSYEIIHPFQK
jgi:hypothetical protein